jgi:hypothetical protein
MEGSKEMFLRMREADFTELPNEIREKFTYVEVREENEYDLHKDDANYLMLYKAQKKAKKDLQDYLYNIRNNHKS